MGTVIQHSGISLHFYVERLSGLSKYKLGNLKGLPIRGKISFYNFFFENENLKLLKNNFQTVFFVFLRFIPANLILIHLK